MLEAETERPRSEGVQLMTLERIAEVAERTNTIRNLINLRTELLRRGADESLDNDHQAQIRLAYGIVESRIAQFSQAAETD